MAPEAGIVPGCSSRFSQHLPESCGRISAPDSAFLPPFRPPYLPLSHPIRSKKMRMRDRLKLARNEHLSLSFSLFLSFFFFFYLTEMIAMYLFIHSLINQNRVRDMIKTRVGYFPQELAIAIGKRPEGKTKTIVKVLSNSV